MAYLYEAMAQDFGTKAGSSQAFAKQGEVYNSIGGTAKYGAYKGTTAQNSWLLSQRSMWKASVAPAATATPVTQPTDPSQVPSYLNAVQEGIKAQREALGSPIKTDEQLKTDIKGSILPDTPIPTAPKMEETFNTLRGEYGVDQLEQDLSLLKNDAQTIYADTRQRKTLERGKAVALNVMEGRISETERQQSEKLDYVNRNISFLTDQLNSSYKAIDMIMGFKNIDYQNAKEEYNTKYNQNLQFYKLFTDAKSQELDLNMQLMKMNQDSAKANLQIYVDMVSKGQLNWATLPEDQKLEINKMEVRSGLGAGFVSKLRMSPEASIKSITTREAGGYKYADVLTLQPDGSLKVTSQQLGRVSSSGGGSGKSAAQQASEISASMISQTNKNLSSKVGADGKNGPGDFNRAKSEWLSAGGKAADFDANFSGYVNPSHYWDYNIDKKYFV